MKNLTDMETRIETIGEAKIDSPILKETDGTSAKIFKSDNDRVLIDVNPDHIIEMTDANETPASFELAGPRKKIYFDPSKLKCALVTCGGLCPGLNNVIRAIVLGLYYRYGVRHIYGIRYGLQGFIPKYGHDLVDLNPQSVVHIHEMGGSILGSSRGPQDIEAIVDCLERLNVGILFMIGGDGTLKAASKIVEEIRNRNARISVIGIPKTIDNDIYMVARSFGFDTAVDIATEAIQGAHKEAEGYPNGIGMIKLMGRYSGFIAATAALAQQDVNFVLIPEIHFDMEGENGLLAKIERRLKDRRHAVILVAEGSGQYFFDKTEKDFDPSGNVKLFDIGVFLKERIVAHFSAKGVEVSLKYIDPSYMIRSLPANANDHVYCGFLGRDAVHAGIAGKTNMIIGHWNNFFVHVPIPLTTDTRKQVTTDGKLWQTVLEATGQGALNNA